MSANINNLPNTVMTQIFLNLAEPDLAKCCCVNKLWNRLASSNAAWSLIAKEHFRNYILGDPNCLGNPNSIDDRTIKTTVAQLYSNITRSNDAIIQRIQGFLDRCSLNETCQFNCILGSGRSYKHITIKITNKNKPSAAIAIKETCFSTKGVGDQALRMAPSQQDQDGYIDKYRIYTTLEPDNSDPLQAKVTIYTNVQFTVLQRVITVVIPEDQLNQKTPMLQQIENMVTSKCNSYAKRKNKIISVVAPVALCAVVIATYLFHSYSYTNAQP